MSGKLLLLCVMQALLFPSRAALCPVSAEDCGVCIRSGPRCAWCAAPAFLHRCQPSEELLRKGCERRYLFNPLGSFRVVGDNSSREPADPRALRLHPREASLTLRPGVNNTFPLTITVPADRPVTDLTVDAGPLPPGVSATFQSGLNENGLAVQVTLKAVRCPEETDDPSRNVTGPWSVHVTPRGYSQSLKLEIALECDCECTAEREEGGSECSGRGAPRCGRCRCDEPYAGARCQADRDAFTPDDQEACRSSPGRPVCSGRGVCVNDACQCDVQSNPNHTYSGMYCQCSNFNCPYYNGRMCGGRGRCECGECLCDSSWTGDACHCSMEVDSCRDKNQDLCNGRGNCVCGECRCLTWYTGKTCETLRT